MTMSMATKAEGTAVKGESIPSSAGALRKKKKIASCKTVQEAKERPSNRSARVSWRLLSCQKTMATAANSRAAVTTTITEKRRRALATAQAPSTRADTPAATFHGLRCE